MGGFLGDLLFGSKSTATTTPTSTLTPEQADKLKELLATLNVSGNSSAAPYTGQLTADQNQVQSLSLAALEQAAMNAIAPNSQGDATTKALTEIINAGPADIKASVVDPTMEDFNQRVLPEINRRFSGMSGFGSDKMLQEGIASGNVATAIAKARADALQKQQELKLAAATSLPGANSAMIQNLLNIQAGGAAGQATAQAPLTAQYLEFQRQLQEKQKNLDTILQALGLKSTENITTVLPGQEGLVQGFVKGFSSRL